MLDGDRVRPEVQHICRKQAGNSCSTTSSPPLSLPQFKNILVNKSNRLRPQSHADQASPRLFASPLPALAWKPWRSGEHCGRSANRSHGEKNKPHARVQILKTCVATPLTSSAVLQSKETPDLFHWAQKKQTEPHGFAQHACVAIYCADKVWAVCFN